MCVGGSCQQQRKRTRGSSKGTPQRSDAPLLDSARKCEASKQSIVPRCPHHYSSIAQTRQKLTCCSSSASAQSGPGNREESPGVSFAKYSSHLRFPAATPQAAFATSAARPHASCSPRSAGKRVRGGGGSEVWERRGRKEEVGMGRRRIMDNTNLTVGCPLGIVETIGQRDQLHREIGSLAFDLKRLAKINSRHASRQTHHYRSQSCDRHHRRQEHNNFILQQRPIKLQMKDPLGCAVRAPTQDLPGGVGSCLRGE